MRKLESWGVAATVLYLAIVGWWVFQNLHQFLCLKLNELGDFLAGTFGPVAFLWLVLGFIQQGREIRLSTDALRLQAEELKNSVEQQAEMVRIQSVNLETQHRLLQPLFEMRHLERHHFEGEFYDSFGLDNSGGYCDCVVVVAYVKGKEVYRQNLEPLNKGTRRRFTVDYLEGQAEIHVFYRSQNNSDGVRVFDTHKWYGDVEGDEGISVRQRPSSI
ncbi:hypothetical protein [Pseudomonas salomonii]|uniref:SMODS-associating 2TM beta-strand rich effector domain-containing protein n=1 Tax=Pseudomonas salomonii TaxID=191391 RepID=A0ABS9GKU5_9PSED|nr:hypothetical protein [Pseudomonas salomonii]MCF5545092.1 hypothetical protein [Pseudomonas salomonii]